MKHFLLFSFLSIPLFAAGDAGHGDIPVKLILVQLLNVGIFVGLLVYFLRAKVKSYYTEKKASYLAEVHRAQKMKEDAEKERELLQVKIQDLKSKAQSELEEAKKKAEEMKASLLSIAAQSAKDIESEAKAAVENEIAKAKKEIRESLLKQSLEQAKKKIESSSNEKDQKAFVDKFVHQIEEVRG